MKTERPHYTLAEECKKWDEEHAAEVAAAAGDVKPEPTGDATGDDYAGGDTGGDEPADPKPAGKKAKK